MQAEHIHATTTETWGFSALASEVPNAVGIGNVYLGTVPYRSGSASSGQSRVAAELKFGVVSIGRLSGSTAESVRIHSPFKGPTILETWHLTRSLGGGGDRLRFFGGRPSLGLHLPLTIEPLLVSLSDQLIDKAPPPYSKAAWPIVPRRRWPWRCILFFWLYFYSQPSCLIKHK